MIKFTRIYFPFLMKYKKYEQNVIQNLKIAFHQFFEYFYSFMKLSAVYILCEYVEQELYKEQRPPTFLMIESSPQVF
jgi:hypothetical protein